MRPAATLVLLAALLTGCSDDPFEDYCAAVQDHQAELSDVLAPGGPEALLSALPIFRDLEDHAPRDIRDEWQQVTAALEALEDALDDAGVDPATYDQDDPPSGLSQAEQDRIEAAATELTSPQTTAAFAGVEQQARDVCNTPLYF